MARSASLATSRWLPSYAWWPPADEYGLTVVLSPYHVTTEREAEFEATIRGFAGAGEPLFEHRTDVYRFGDEVAVELDRLDVPGPPSPSGGVVEIHPIRLDRPPSRTVDFLGQWVHAEGRNGGGYIDPDHPRTRAGEARRAGRPAGSARRDVLARGRDRAGAAQPDRRRRPGADHRFV